MADYRAGRLLVSIIPEMRGIARKVQREFGGLGPYAVPVTAKVDQRALDGLRRALRTLPDVVVTARTSVDDRELADLRKRIMSLHDVTIGVDMTADQARREIDDITGRLDRLARNSPDIAVRVDAAAAQAALDDTARAVDNLHGRTAKINATADVRQARSGLLGVGGLVDRLDGRRANVNVIADIGDVITKLAGVQAAVAAFVNRDYRFRVRADVAGAASSISRILLLIGALTAAGGGAIGVIGGLAGALGGLGAAGAVGAGGIAAAVLGFRGVGKAVGALSQAQESAAATAKQTAKQQEAAARQVESAQRGVNRASEAAVKARRDGLRDVQAAERAYTAAQRDARMAQVELTRAWEEGRRALEDLQDQLDMGKLDQEQAALDLKDAKKALDEARASGDQDAITRADLAYRRQLETIDQLNKRVRRLGADNGAAQRAGVAGSEQVRAASERARAASEAEGQAAQGVRDARESAAERIRDADEAVIDAQRALTDALRESAEVGQDTGDKIAQAFADLSPAAAAFARKLFGLKPILDMLSATAAAGLFPPISAGIDALLTRLPEIQTVIGQLAAGTGIGLGMVLTQLADPFWSQFFGMLGNAAGTVIPGLFASLMTLARAAATLVTALMPLAPVGFMVLDALSGLIASWSGPLAQALGAMVPATMAFIGALHPLGPLLVALAPIANALGIALSQVLGALLTALAPVLVALTPLFQVFAQVLATQLVGAINAVLPLMISVATWMSQNPTLVIGVITAIMGLLGALKPLSFLFGVLVTWLARSLIIAGVTSLLTSLGLAGTAAGRGILLLLQPFSALQTLLGYVGQAITRSGGLFAMLRTAIMWVGRAILTALGPIGILIVAFGILYSSSEPFRNAVNQLLDVVMQLVGALVSAVMPIFNALSNVLSMVAGVFGQLVQQLAVALIPVINIVSGVLMQLVGAVLPPLMQIVNALVPVIMMLGQVFVELVSGALGPVIAMIGELAARVLPPLIGILMSALMPVIVFVADVIATVLVWAIEYLLIPALKLISWIITTVLVPVFTWLVSMIVPALTWIGNAAMWLWTNAIEPVVNFIWTALKFLGAIIFVILVAPFLIAWNIISAAAVWLWSSVIQPVFQAIGDFIGWVWSTLIQPALAAMVWFWQTIIAPALMWLWTTIFQPLFRLIGMFISWTWETIIRPALMALVWLWTNVIAPAAMWLWNNVISPAFEGIGSVITWVWENVIRPCFDAVMDGLDWLGRAFEDATNWIRDIWNRIRGYLAAPINFLIDVVWNKGILSAWNAVAGLLGIPPIQPLGLIPENAGGGLASPNEGGTKRARGGLLRGPGGPTDDRILGLDGQTRQATSWVSADEFVVRGAITKRTLPFLTALNAGDGEALQAAGGNRRTAPKVFRGRSGFDQNVPRRALGGLVGLPMLAAGGGPFQQRIDEAKRWLSGPATGAPYVYGGGTNPRAGMDCSSMQSAVTHILSGRPPDSGRIGTTATMPWSGFVGGLSSDYAIGNKPSDHMAGTLQGQNVEQHGPNGTPFRFPSRWGADNGYFTQQWSLPIVGGQFVSGGNGGGGGNWLLDKARAVFAEFTDPAIDAIKAFVGEPPPEWRKVPPGLATLIRDKLADWVFGKAEAQGGGSGVDISNISGPVHDQVREVARRMGYGDGPEWEAIKWIISHENRGWDPNAKNPTSNARGLFQKMTSVHGPIEPTVAGQAAWGITYMRDRYGSPTAAKRFWEANGHYAQGGLVAPVFDSGGIMRGKGMIFKDVIEDERVLDPIETSSYDRLGPIADALEGDRFDRPRGLDPAAVSQMAAWDPRAGGGAGGPGDRHYHLGPIREHVDVDRVMAQIDFEERRTRL